MLESLLQQREELLEQIRRIAETCEGIENEANARRVTELNGRQAELLAQKDELKAKLSALDGELGSIGKNIQDLSGSGLEKILQAIKNQRWFFFANKPKVLMDRDTALLWADLNYFPWGKNNNSNSYSSSNSYAEVKTLIEKTNSDSFGGFNDWKVPTPFELWKMIEDISFPFQEGSCWYIKGRGGWCVDNDGSLYGKNLYYSGATNELYTGNTYVIPCSHAYVPADYENNISPSNNFYTETEKLQFTLNVFVENELVPLFKDEAITQLYRKIFVDKPALMKQLAEVEAQIVEQEASQVRLTANFNYRPLLAKYDVAAIAKSPIKYFDAVLNVADKFLDILQEYEAAQAETIADAWKIARKLNDIVEDPKLTTEENFLLDERRYFLATRLELGTDEPKRKILLAKDEAEIFFLHLDKAGSYKNPIHALAELYAEPRAGFDLLVESLARTVLGAQRKVDFFVGHRDFIARVVNIHAQWSDAYRAFKTTLRDEFAAACRAKNIDEKIFDAWCNDWQKKRFAIEQRFLPLVKFAFKGKLIDATERTLAALQEYRDAVDKFYLHERNNIRQKFASKAGGDLQEKCETESTLYKFAAKFQRDLQTIIFARDKTEERFFLLRWAEPLLTLPLDEMIDFIRDRELNAVSTELLNQFDKLRQQNFEKYLVDSKSCGEAIQKRENDFNALITRMRKNL